MLNAFDAVDGSSQWRTSAMKRAADKALILRSHIMRNAATTSTIPTIGLDIAKSVFQVHAIDAHSASRLRE